MTLLHWYGGCYFEMCAGRQTPEPTSANRPSSNTVDDNDNCEDDDHDSNEDGDHRRTGPTTFGGAEDFCPNIFSGAPALKNSLSGVGPKKVPL